MPDCTSSTTKCQPGCSAGSSQFTDSATDSLCKTCDERVRTDFRRPANGCSQISFSASNTNFTRKTNSNKRAPTYHRYKLVHNHKHHLIMPASQPKLPEPQRQLIQRPTTTPELPGVGVETPIWVPRITTQLPYTHAANIKKGQHNQSAHHSNRSTHVQPPQPQSNSPYSTEYLPREQHCMTHRINFAIPCHAMTCVALL